MSSAVAKASILSTIKIFFCLFKVSYQETLSMAYLNQMDSSESYFKRKEREWNQNTALFLLKILDVYKKGKDVVSILNHTKVIINNFL